ncbi:enoyl-CoA delta isomerase 1, mitochondrial [Nematostella vectensis]|uniref:enoyl-CoA delta isomerase 1, mitochondrial n=1 Tax=Nematostella vectensis TaxID=45351 RepID=UPI0020772418|nr:enoyl-CoA delta isomerase 1, mitochondrial [Nematostella vectensis]XP_048575873.1 enoyl-CoA delta isomerase 1, mitochondrial [Nematostella vectensis]
MAASCLRAFRLGAARAGSFLPRAQASSPTLVNQMRYNSSISLNEKDNGVAELVMHSEPSNSWSLDFLEEFCLAMEDLENDRDCRGVIITSNIPRIFSYGTDINELYQTKADRLKVYRRRQQEFWQRLYGSRLATVASINGNSPGGGCLVALACDYRIMAPGFKIGYNEVKGGLLAASWDIATMVSVLGRQVTERSVQVGQMFTSEEALKVGMVDEIVPLGEASAAAMAAMEKWLRIPDKIRSKAKLTLRREELQRMQDRREEDLREFVARVQKDYTQKSIQNLLEKRKQKGHDAPFIWGEE